MQVNRSHKMDLQIIKQCRLQGEKWMGIGQSYTTMIGFTAMNNSWLKIIPTNTMSHCYRIPKLFALNPSQDDLTRIQIAIGTDPNTAFLAGNYTETMIKFDGASYIIREMACPRFDEKVDTWLRIAVDNNPGNDATLEIFICTQVHDVV